MYVHALMERQGEIVTIVSFVGRSVIQSVCLSVCLSVSLWQLFSVSVYSGSYVCTCTYGATGRNCDHSEFCMSVCLSVCLWQLFSVFRILCVYMYLWSDREKL